jgi:hypothetical protein
MEDKNKTRLQKLAGIESQNNFDFLISYDISGKDNKYFQNFSDSLQSIGSEFIHESLYEFKNANVTEIINAIINLLNGNKPSDETHIKVIMAQDNELQLTSIIN